MAHALEQKLKPACVRLHDWVWMHILQASTAQAPAASLQQQPGLLPISSLLDQGQALLPSWLPNWGGRRMLRAGEEA